MSFAFGIFSQEQAEHLVDRFVSAYKHAELKISFVNQDDQDFFNSYLSTYENRVAYAEPSTAGQDALVYLWRFIGDKRLSGRIEGQF